MKDGVRGELGVRRITVGIGCNFLWIVKPSVIGVYVKAPQALVRIVQHVDQNDWKYVVGIA